MNIATTMRLAMSASAISFAPLMCNMSDDSDGMDFSLADLSDLDISEVAEIRYESLPAGVYGFKIGPSTMEETTNRDNEKRFVIEVPLEVVEVKAVVKKLPSGESTDKFVGKQHKEKYYIVPEKALEGIGRFRAAVTDMGANGEGKLGDVVASLEGHTFYAKISEQKDREDPSRVYARLNLDAKLNK